MAVNIQKELENKIISCKNTIKDAKRMIMEAKQSLELYQLLDCLLYNKVVIVTNYELTYLLAMASIYDIALTTCHIEIMVNLIHKDEENHDVDDLTKWSVYSLNNQYHYINNTFDRTMTTCSNNVLNPPLNSFQWEIDHESGVDGDGSSYTYSPKHKLWANGYYKCIEIRKI